MAISIGLERQNYSTGPSDGVAIPWPRQKPVEMHAAPTSSLKCPMELVKKLPKPLAAANAVGLSHVP